MSALDDLRVLDLTRILGGPYCTMMLADMGADVVKVEPPGGDLVRETPPYCEDAAGEPYGGYFQSVNRGKRSIELDFRTAEDRQHFLDLVDVSDVVVENYQAGTMESFDLSYERLAERNPELVYASLRGFGDPRTGETDNQDRPAFDLVAQALGGIMHINGQADSPPTKFSLGIGDIFTGTLQAIGILAALHYRSRTGEGQYVDVGMYDSMVSLAERAVYQYSYTGEVPTRQGNSHPTLFPYNAFQAEDGYVVIAAMTSGQWKALCDHMGRPDLGPKFADANKRLEHRESLEEVIAGWIRSKTVDELLETLRGDVPAAPVQTVADVFEDDHVRARDMLVEVAQPGTEETVEIAGNPIKMTESPPEPDGRAPLLDEHREEVLGMLRESATRVRASDGGQPEE
jgi:succinyl-CoA:mesaconate CoA transferase